eukprot:tig00001057_g6683.t1
MAFAAQVIAAASSACRLQFSSSFRPANAIRRSNAGPSLPAGAQQHFDCRAESVFGAVDAPVSRRTALLAGLAAALAVAGPAPARAADEAIVKAVRPIVEARALIDKIPGLIEAEQWDKVRTLLKNAPVGKLEQIVTAAADKSTDPEEAFEEMDATLSGLRDADNAFYLLAVQFPNEENKKNFLFKARTGLDRGIEHFDKLIALFDAAAVAEARASL